MNEQLKKLYNEAVVYTMDNAGSRGQNSSNMMCAEKFAELIVKETLQVARAGIEYGDGMEDAVYRYFGVEE